MRKCRTPYCRNNAAKQRTICHKCRSQKYKKNNPFRYFYNAHRTRTRQRYIPFTISFEEWKKIWQESGKWEKKLAGEDWTMHRMDNNRGYESGNVKIVSMMLNVEVWWNEDRWQVDFRWRKMWSERNGKPVEECPF